MQSPHPSTARAYPETTLAIGIGGVDAVSLVEDEPTAEGVEVIAKQVSIHVGDGYLVIAELGERADVACQRMGHQHLVVEHQLVNARKRGEQPDTARTVLQETIQIVGLYNRVFVG